MSGLIKANPGWNPLISDRNDTTAAAVGQLETMTGVWFVHEIHNEPEYRDSNFVRDFRNKKERKSLQLFSLIMMNKLADRLDVA